MSGAVPLLPSTTSCSARTRRLSCNVMLECHDLDAIHEPLQCGCAAVRRDVVTRAPQSC
jgi:hypothetical protein